MKTIPLAVLLFLIGSTAFAQPATPPCTPGKVCRPASIVTPGSISLNSFLTIGPAGSQHRLSSSGSTFYLDNSGGATLYACGGGICNFSQTLWSPSVLTTTADITSASYLRSQGVAFASFPTCNGGVAGAILYDTTNSCEKICNGTAWSVCVQPSSYINNYWSAMCIGAPCTEVASFTGGIYSLGGSVTRATCSWATIGVAGGSNTVVVKIRNTTAGSDLCSCTLGACNIAINTPTSCTCSGTFTSGSLYTWQLDAATDCATIPGNIICTASVVP